MYENNGIKFFWGGCCKVLTIYMKVNCEKLKMYISNPRSRTKKKNKNKTNNPTKKEKNLF